MEIGRSFNVWSLKSEKFFREDFFPDGGIEAYIKHKFPLVAHNRWFGPDNVYAKENGGEYDFVIDDIEVDLPGPPGSGRGPYAYPNDTKFWPDFMSDRKQWGLMTYEQDWARSNSFFGNVTKRDFWK